MVNGLIHRILNGGDNGSRASILIRNQVIQYRQLRTFTQFLGSPHPSVVRAEVALSHKLAFLVVYSNTLAGCISNPHNTCNSNVLGFRNEAGGFPSQQEGVHLHP